MKRPPSHAKVYLLNNNVHISLIPSPVSQTIQEFSTTGSQTRRMLQHQIHLATSLICTACYSSSSRPLFFLLIDSCSALPFIILNLAQRSAVNFVPTGGCHCARSASLISMNSAGASTAPSVEGAGFVARASSPGEKLRSRLSCTLASMLESREWVCAADRPHGALSSSPLSSGSSSESAAAP